MRFKLLAHEMLDAEVSRCMSKLVRMQPQQMQN